MKIIVNGEAKDVDANVTVDRLVQDLAGGQSARGVAVAVNGDVVGRERWSRQPLAEGDRVEVLSAWQGGT